MWRPELKLEFHKGTHFLEACDRVGVPVDSLEEASDLWDDWSEREHYERLAA